MVSFYRIVELPRRPGLTRPISGTYESGAAHGHRPLQQAKKKHGKCKMTQADAKGNDDLQGARFLRNFTSSKSRSTPDRDSLTATSALRSALRRFCLCSDSVLTPFWLRSDSVLTPLWLLFSADEMPINTGVSAISNKSPIRAKASKVEKTPDFSSIFVSPRARVSIQRPLPHRKRDFQRLSFPDCEIRQTEMAETVKEGGALHCISWNIPVWTPNQCWTLMNNPAASYHLLWSHS